MRARDVLARNVVVMAGYGIENPWDMNYDQYLDTLAGIEILSKEKPKNGR